MLPLGHFTAEWFRGHRRGRHAISGDHRRGLLGAGRSHRTHRSWASGHAVRAGRRGRRGVAGEHLPRRRVRRTVGVLQLFVRAQSTVVASLRPAAGDPRLPPAGRDQIRCAPTYPIQDLDRRRDVRLASQSVAAAKRHRRRTPRRRPRPRCRATLATGLPTSSSTQRASRPPVSSTTSRSPASTANPCRTVGPTARAPISA